jgi:hypothetical protein
LPSIAGGVGREGLYVDRLSFESGGQPPSGSHALFDASLKQPVSPFVVADKIVEIVRSETWKLAPPRPRRRVVPPIPASMSDEQWVDLMSIESDQEWAAILKRDFGLEVDLGG